jgi:hypothetical protein
MVLLESEMLYVNQIYKFLTIVLITITILDITRRPVFYLKSNWTL